MGRPPLSLHDGRSPTEEILSPGPGPEQRGDLNMHGLPPRFRLASVAPKGVGEVSARRNQPLQRRWLPEARARISSLTATPKEGALANGRQRRTVRDVRVVSCALKRSLCA